MIQTAKGTTAVVPVSTAGGVIANTVISKKKAKKIERNMKYAQLRRESTKKNSGDVEMIDEDGLASGHSGAKESAVRKALWTVVENAKVSGVPLLAAVGEGTTLGGPAF